MFGFKKKNRTWKARVEDVAGLEEMYNACDKNREEYLAKVKPIREELTKGSTIISELYKKHGIEKVYPGHSYQYIDDRWLDIEVAKDLCIFNEQELAVLEKWIPKYKELRSAELKLMNEEYAAHSEILAMYKQSEE